MDSSPAPSWNRPSRLPWLQTPQHSLNASSKPNHRGVLVKRATQRRTNHSSGTRSLDGNASSSSRRRADTQDSTASNTATATSSPDVPQRAAGPRRESAIPPEAQSPQENDKPAKPLAQMARDLKPGPSSMTATSDEHSHAKSRFDRTDTDIMNEAVLRSISGLERQMKESVHLANDAAHHNNTEEVQNILGNAERALDDSIRIAENQHRRVQDPLDDGGGAVPWSPTADDKDDKNDFEGSTYSVSTSDSDASAGRLPLPDTAALTTGTDRSGPSAPSRAVVTENPQTRDWAYKSSGLGLPSGLRRLSTAPKQTRFEGRPAEISPSSQGPPERPADAGGIQRSLTIKQPKALSSEEELPVGPFGQARGGHNWGRDKFDDRDYLSSGALKGKSHVTLRDDQKFSIHHHKRQPIARNWETPRKRLTALVACLNTALIGIIVGIYVSVLCRIGRTPSIADWRRPARFLLYSMR